MAFFSLRVLLLAPLVRNGSEVALLLLQLFVLKDEESTVNSLTGPSESVRRDASSCTSLIRYINKFPFVMVHNNKLLGIPLVSEFEHVTPSIVQSGPQNIQPLPLIL